MNQKQSTVKMENNLDDTHKINFIMFIVWLTTVVFLIQDIYQDPVKIWMCIAIITFAVVLIWQRNDSKLTRLEEPSREVDFKPNREE